MAFISNGTTILDAGAFNVNLGSLVLISEQTASSSSTVSFTSGIDSTYPIYKFEFINIHPSTDDADFTFQTNASGGSGYNETITSTTFRANHSESGDTSLSYGANSDQAQGTSFQILMPYMDNDN